MREKLQYYDVFVPGGYPNHTYNPRETLTLEQKVESVLQNLCKLVVVTGHTKSGKTVLVQKTLPRDSAVWIDGGGINDEEDFWSIIINELDLFQGTEVQASSGKTREVDGSTAIGGNALFVKGEVKAGAKTGENSGESVRYSRNVSSKASALAGLRSARVPLVIDDFHYLPKGDQGNIIRALKPLVFEGVPVVIIAIPHRRYDAVKVEKEMTGRILSVEVPVWDDIDLSFIPNTGFALLDHPILKEAVVRLAQEAVGSPHLMQEFCRAICKEDYFVDDIENVFRTTAENTIGRPIFEKLARGPRRRSDRIARKLKSGESVDIYGLVLGGLAHIRPGLVTLEYEDLRAAIKEICTQENVPNIQEVARVLRHMAEISATDESSTPVIDFDEDEKRLHITDPFFAFYLRWGSVSQ